MTTATQPRAEPENAILDRDVHQPQLSFKFLQPPRAAPASESIPIEPLENGSIENQQMQLEQGTVQFDPLDI